ncbi:MULTISPECIES: S41 family peptidase [unclassified Chryseobacterium]|uniref:S41 family peptidase n=1 Tax=unclassified Chryseobacterium TaxID=2593645 RepID=UPI00100BFBA8|nr:MULTISPECIES: S41 family peptidase [unclassified Chryseobacterium]RXM51325.1 peptidase S41 [Chryseobacterium sp. CH25]RXM64935.1 peptidase S41 [Chryseobacterium sp. CH1]
MIKAKALLLILVTSSAWSFAQSCNCESNYQWVKKTFEENDAGFQYIIDKKGTAAYEFHNKEFLNKIRNTKSDTECNQTIYDWLKFFRSGHFSIKKIENNKDPKTQPKEEIKTELVPINLEKFKKEIQFKKESDLEGIWEADPYTIGIKKFGDIYKGFIIQSGAENWKPNELKLTINADKTKGIFYVRDKTGQEVNNIHFVGKNHLEIGDFTLKRVSPKFDREEGIETYYEAIQAEKPFLKVMNSTTLLLRIPSFNGALKKEIDSVITANKTKIESTENLIIDIRNNGGGSDISYAEIIPYLYTNPIRSIRTQFYSTPLNNQRMIFLYENYEKYGISKEDREFMKKSYDKLNGKLGQFVSLQEDDSTVGIEKLDKIYPYPKNVGIIINNGNGSTAEEFLLAAKQSKKVKLFGTTTAGVLDVSNMYFVNSPCNEIKFGYSLSKSFRIPDMAIDGKGIQPDYFIDKTIPDYQWIDYVNGVLNEK